MGIIDEILGNTSAEFSAEGSSGSIEIRYGQPRGGSVPASWVFLGLLVLLLRKGG